MATVVLHSTAGGSNITDLAYGSLSYDATKVYYLSATMRRSGASPDTPSPTLTNATFSPLTTALFAADGIRRFCVWRFTVSTNTTAVLTFPTFSAAHWVDSHLVECTGYDLVAPEVQTKRGDMADLISVTFTITADSVPAAGNSMLWMSGYAAGYDYTPGTGFTELADTNGSSETDSYTQWKNTGDQTAETTAPANDGYSAGLLIELAVAVAAVPRQAVPIVGASQAAQRASRW